MGVGFGWAGLILGFLRTDLSSTNSGISRLRNGMACASMSFRWAWARTFYRSVARNGLRAVAGSHRRLRENDGAGRHGATGPEPRSLRLSQQAARTKGGDSRGGRGVQPHLYHRRFHALLRPRDGNRTAANRHDSSRQAAGVRRIVSVQFTRSHRGRTRAFEGRRPHPGSRRRAGEVVPRSHRADFFDAARPQLADESEAHERRDRFRRGRDRNKIKRSARRESVWCRTASR